MVSPDKTLYCPRGVASACKGLSNLSTNTVPMPKTRCGFNRTFHIIICDHFQRVAHIPYPATLPKYYAASEMKSILFIDRVLDTLITRIIRRLPVIVDFYFIFVLFYLRTRMVILLHNHALVQCHVDFSRIFSFIFIFIFLSFMLPTPYFYGGVARPFLYLFNVPLLFLGRYSLIFYFYFYSISFFRYFRWDHSLSPWSPTSASSSRSQVPRQVSSTSSESDDSLIGTYHR